MKLTHIRMKPDGLVHLAEADARPGIDCVKAIMLHDDDRPWANVLCRTTVYVPVHTIEPARGEPITCLRCLALRE